jgi:5-methylcytosine-specific restriction enzyme B
MIASNSAYLMWARTLDDLRDAFAKRIIPLLQEYFFDDLGKVALTLTGRDGTSPFVLGESLRSDQLFPGSRRNIVNTERWRYVITDPATWRPEAFVAIYSPPTASESGPNAEEA